MARNVLPRSFYDIINPAEAVGVSIDRYGTKLILSTILSL